MQKHKKRRKKHIRRFLCFCLVPFYLQNSANSRARLLEKF